ncbi:MAG: CaiB/BaiF CoA-transferase family protein [Dehalococcoidia bacterium]|nr:CaiB/BaiF CoA-transferase family protein [Dehalococcoidia bacterium]
MDRPLEGVRILSMEQAAALPFATRHLADLGAEVIRVESHRRGRTSGDADLFRNKRRFGLDLAMDGGPEVFRRVAAGCDVVAHNFTPRVMRKYGIDFEAIREVNPDVIYVSLTGFGTTGPWGERPLFGPGAEAVSGQNDLIGDPDGWPGRPGTIVYADNTCGLNTAFAILAALDWRDATGEPVHIDISLYETAISHLGPVITERAFGGNLPHRTGNADPRFALHGVFDVAGRDRHVAVTATAAEAPALARTLGLSEVTEAAVRAAVAGRPGAEVVAMLQAAGVPAAEVADAADYIADEHLWARGNFGLLGSGEGAHPHAGPAFGGGRGVAMVPPQGLGDDNRAILRDIAGMTEAEVDALERADIIGSAEFAAERPRSSAEHYAVRIDRAEIARVDHTHGAWRGRLS